MKSEKQNVGCSLSLLFIVFSLITDPQLTSVLFKPCTVHIILFIHLTLKGTPMSNLVSPNSWEVLYGTRSSVCSLKYYLL